MEIRTVDRYIKELKEKGLIYVQQRGLRQSNVYFFVKQEWQGDSEQESDNDHDDTHTNGKNSRSDDIPECTNSVPPIKDHCNKYISHEGPTPHATHPIKKPFQPEIVKNMVKIWEETVEEGGCKIELTAQRIAFLLQALKDKFNQSLDKWREFCERIASSRFLMGEIREWKASLDWCLSFKNMAKIFEGKLYGFGDRAKRIKQQEIKQSTEEEILEISI